MAGYPPFEELRRAFAELDVARYRGICRNYLLWLPPERGVIEKWQADGIDIATNASARHHFYEILERHFPNPTESSADEDMCISLEEAKEVVSLTDAPENWEVIHLSRVELPRSSVTLGYDVGYWCGDHFSLIADTVVMPRWHPPAPPDFPALRQALAPLNEHLLFNSPEAAADFRRWYISRPWAEIESCEGEFAVIQVDETC